MKWFARALGARSSTPKTSGVHNCGRNVVDVPVSRHHTDDLVDFAVDFEILSYRAWIAVETLLPQGEAQDHDVIVSSLILVRKKRASKHGQDPNHGEVVGCHAIAVHRFWIAFTRERERMSPLHGGHVLEHVVLLLPRLEIGRGSANQVKALEQVLGRNRA
jgi:hypothetical protein